MFSGSLLNIFIEECSDTILLIEENSLIVNVVDFFVSSLYSVLKISNNKNHQCKNIQTWYS